MRAAAPETKPPSFLENAMRTTTLLLFVTVSVAIAFAQEQEKKIRRADLPPAVEKTVASESQGATVKGFSEERENGQTYYEAEMTVSGHSKDVLIDKDGAIVEVEEQVALDSLPADVKSGLQSKAGSGKILKVESLTKYGKLVAYEAKVEANGKKKEIQVGPDGKALDHEE
jgi:uncharacterized membrane protein YkoI